MKKNNLFQEITRLFRKCFPYIVRDDETIRQILAHEGNIFVEERNDAGDLVGISVIHENVILLFCVEEAYRNNGIGESMLKRSEALIGSGGYQTVKIGVGFDYFMPGVPTSKRYADAVNECLDERITDEAGRFFEAHGYKHSQDGNIFDMRFALKEFSREAYSVGDTINGITYRFATESDKEAVYACTDDALKEFTKWYQYEGLYSSEPVPKVLIATDGKVVCGALLVEVANEEQKLGTIGCTSVRKAYQGKGIATNMVTLGTKYLRDIGMKDAYLSYTYTGLDKLYGYAGYKIFVYYMMAQKEL